MKMKTRLVSTLVLLATSCSVMSATEVERLRALCEEQEMQIQQLELKIARLTNTPPPAASEAVVKQEEAPASENATYTIQSGDSIERIARRKGVSVSAINQLNGLKNDSIIHPGQKLKLPGSMESTAGTSPNQSSSASVAKIYKVASGDTFYGIAKKNGVTVEQLIAANPGVDHRALRVGQSIKLNTAEETVAAPSAPEPTASFESTSPLPVANRSEPASERRASDKPVRIEKEITYGQFAKNHNTSTKRLDELNGLELDPSTVLAQGSELYIPAQP